MPGVDHCNVYQDVKHDLYLGPYKYTLFVKQFSDYSVDWNPFKPEDLPTFAHLAVAVAKYFIVNLNTVVASCDNSKIYKSVSPEKFFQTLYAICVGYNPHLTTVLDGKFPDTDEFWDLVKIIGDSNGS